MGSRQGPERAGEGGTQRRGEDIRRTPKTTGGGAEGLRSSFLTPKGGGGGGAGQGAPVTEPL